MENTAAYNIPLKLMEQKKEKKHRCEKCNKDFMFKSELEKHYRTELHKTGKKKTRSDKKEPFKCMECGLYETKYTSNLKLHILKNHKTIEEKIVGFPFYCKLCDTGFLYIETYSTHLQTKKHNKREELYNKMNK